MKKILTLYFTSWWLPSLIYISILVALTVSSFLPWDSTVYAVKGLTGIAAVAFLGLISASLGNLIKKRWGVGITHLVLLLVCGFATFFVFGFVLFSSMLGPSEDGFADNLTIPEGIELAEPEQDATDPWQEKAPLGDDVYQEIVRRALTVPGDQSTEFTPAIPSLRRASIDHANTFLDYVEASPNWHVFVEQGNRFASRRWSYGGEPRGTLHGYISEFSGASRFQTRCLLCLDRKQWSRYSVQHALEGTKPVTPKMTMGNDLHESRIMIECGGIWVEIFEQSDKPERRVTKATITALENEFSEFLRDPENVLYTALAQSRELARRLAGDNEHPFRLLIGMQPGIYGIVYSLNPGEPGSVYLKAFEITKGTPLSVESLEAKSKTRMAWSEDPSERFGAKAGFTIYEGDWGKPYAARFEVWFKPDSSKPDRKLAERNFKIEGWQR